MDERLIEDALKVVEPEIGPVSPIARIEITRAVWEAIDAASRSDALPWLVGD